MSKPYWFGLEKKDKIARNYDSLLNTVIQQANNDRSSYIISLNIFLCQIRITSQKRQRTSFNDDAATAFPQIYFQTIRFK